MIVRCFNREITVPESWDDLSLRNLYAAYAILMSDAPAFLDAQEVPWYKRLSLAQHFLDLSEDEINAWRRDCINAAEDAEAGHAVFISELDELLSNFNRFWEADPEQPDAWRILLTRTKVPYYVLSSKEQGAEYYGPDDALDNITLYELGQTFTLFEQYLETRDETLVHQLIATLYRPSKPYTQSNVNSDYEGDRRLPLQRHERTVAHRAAQMATLPPLAKQIILFWFASCRQHIISQYQNLFRSPEDDDTPGERVGNDYAWGGLIMSMANDITQIDGVAAQPYRNAFVYLSFLEDKRKMEEMKMKQNRVQ